MASSINLILASDNKELPIESLAPTYEYYGTGSNKKISRILVNFKGKTYAKVFNYDVDGDIVNHVVSGSEYVWNVVTP